MSEAVSNAFGCVGWSRGWAGMVTTLLLSSALPGCPLSDKYFIDPNAGIAASAGTTGAGTGNSGGSGAVAGVSSGTGRVMVGGAGMIGSDMTSGFGGAGITVSGCVPEPERCDGISNDCDVEVDEDSACPTGCTAKRYDDHLYLLCVSVNSTSFVDANKASSRCSELGVQFQLEQSLGLVWIESSVENEFLKDWLKTTASSDAIVWTAANDDSTEGKWVWGRRTTAEQFFSSTASGGGSPYMARFNDFAPGQPNGAHDDDDCGAFEGALSWQWADEFCTTLLPGFVCEEHPLE